MGGHRLEVIGEVETVGLAVLHRDVADVDPHGGRGEHGVADAGHQQARQDAREEAARSEDDDVGLLDRAHGVLGDRDVVGRQPDPLDAGRPGDPRLALDRLAVESAGRAGPRGRGDGQDLAADRQDPVHLADALLEVAALDGRERGDEQVADGVAGQARRVIPVAGGLPPGSGTGAARP